MDPPVSICGDGSAAGTAVPLKPFDLAQLADAGQGSFSRLFACRQAPQLNLKPVDAYGWGRVDADSSLLAAHLEQNDANVVADDNFLTDVTCKD
jgi:hypothetical protein